MVERLDLSRGVQAPYHHNERLVGKMGTKKVHREVKRKLEKEGYFVEDMGFNQNGRGPYKKFMINGLFLIKISSSPRYGIDQYFTFLVKRIKFKLHELNERMKG